MRLLVADDDARFRALVRARLDALATPSDVVEAADGAEAVQLGLQLRPSIVLLDLQMPRLGGVEAATTLRGLRPEARIALLSGRFDTLVEQAAHPGVPLFDKLDLDRALDWAAAELERAVLAGGAPLAAGPR